MVWIIILLLVVGVAIATIVFKNNNMQKTLAQAVDVDHTLVREALDASVKASNSVSPIIALKEVAYGQAILQTLRRRYGAMQLEEMTQVDTNEVAESLQKQHDLILNELNKKHPEALPSNMKEKYEKYVFKRDQDF